MACSQQVYVFLFLLAVIGCLEIQFSEGRQLKAAKVKIETGLQKRAEHATNVVHSLDSRKEDQHATGHRKISPSVTPSQGQEFSNLEDPRMDALQSTTQGNSPGVGHEFSGQKHNAQTNMQSSTLAAGETDGFQYGMLGHSPGVGHSFGKLKEGSKA